VYPQAEHQRLAGVIAAAWGNDQVERPPLPFESWVRGVAVHDRAYGELDTDLIGAIAPERWIEIQTPAVEPQTGDAVVDLVVAMHVQRLADDFVDLDAHVPDRLADAGVEPEDAAAADVITNLCDTLSFTFCFEEPASGSVGAFSYAVSADGSATLAPWPLGVPELTETVVGYRADGYPQRLDPVERVFRLRPA
jgi:hypothetical protein